MKKAPPVMVREAVMQALPGLRWWLRNYRIELGMSRSALAATMNISHQRLSQMENGYANVQLDELAHWAAFLNVRLLVLDVGTDTEIVIDADEFFIRPYFADEPHPLENAA